MLPAFVYTASVTNDMKLGRGLHSFPFQLNLSTPCDRITHLNSCQCLELLKLSSDVNECKPLKLGPTLVVTTMTVLINGKGHSRPHP